MVYSPMAIIYYQNLNVFIYFYFVSQFYTNVKVTTVDLHNLFVLKVSHIVQTKSMKIIFLCNIYAKIH